MTRFPGPAPGACCAGPHSPRPPPLAPPAPPRIAPPCSSASQLLWRGLTSHCPCIIGYGSSPSRCGPAAQRRRPDVRSPGSRARSVRTCQGLRPRRAVRALALSRPSVLPSASDYGVGARDVSFAAQWLAYAIPCRRFAAGLAASDARLGADVVRYSFIVVGLSPTTPCRSPGAQCMNSFVSTCNG